MHFAMCILPFNCPNIYSFKQFYSFHFRCMAACILFHFIFSCSALSPVFVFSYSIQFFKFVYIFRCLYHISHFPLLSAAFLFVPCCWCCFLFSIYFSHFLIYYLIQANRFRSSQLCRWFGSSQHNIPYVFSYWAAWAETSCMRAAMSANGLLDIYFVNFVMYVNDRI